MEIISVPQNLHELTTQTAEELEREREQKNNTDNQSYKWNDRYYEIIKKNKKKK